MTYSYNACKKLSVSFAATLILFAAGCQKQEVGNETGVAADRAGTAQTGGGSSNAIQAGKYTILDTRTDMTDRARAKQNVEDAIIKYPEVDCFVGLWSYNPPAILSAVTDAGKLGQIGIVGFDEEEDTINGVKAGHIFGTIVQQPFEFGLQSVRILTALAKGDESVIPPNKIVDIPVKVIVKDNVDTFWDELQATIKSAEQTPVIEPGPGIPNIAFVTNNPSDFWRIARAGVNRGMQEYNAICEFHMPPDGTSSDQQRIVEALVAKGIQGIAISPNDPANQSAFFDTVAEKTNLICHDSDAPDSKRKCYVGTNNYMAGREAGKLVKKLLPDGGEIMIFVGQMDAQNAQDRRNGVIDELADKPIPENVPGGQAQ